MAIDMWRVRFSSAAGDIGDYRDKRERARERQERENFAGVESTDLKTEQRR